MEQDFASNVIILFGLFGAFIVSLGVCELIVRTGRWLSGRGFNGDKK